MKMPAIKSRVLAKWYHSEPNKNIRFEPLQDRAAYRISFPNGVVLDLSYLHLAKWAQANKPIQDLLQHQELNKKEW